MSDIDEHPEADATPIEDRVPTTDEVRERFVDGFPMDTWVVARAQFAAEFDRWLAKVRADTLREAATELESDDASARWELWDHTRMEYSTPQGWLRAEADRIEKGDPSDRA